MRLEKKHKKKEVIGSKSLGTMIVAVLFLLSALLISGCRSESDAVLRGNGPDAALETGTLAFVADGEEMAREGMVSKDGWAIDFDHAYITLADIKAYQTDPPYDTDKGWDFDYQEMIALAGKHTIDLADPAADPALVGEAGNAPAGHYNAISWTMARADSGPSGGYVLLLIGTAEKDGRTIEFSLGIEQEVKYLGGDYLGDERKGILSPGGSAEVEMTFHFDHLFGTDEEEPDDPMNLGALGFDPLAALAVDGFVEIDSAMLDADDIALLEGVLLHFGHVGEGHCLAKINK